MILLLACTTAPVLSLPDTDRQGAAVADAVAERLKTEPMVRFSDGPVQVAVLPLSATLTVVRRTPDTETFTDAARRADQPDATDVTINGMTYSFDPTAHQSGSMQATGPGAHGQVFADGVVTGGQPLKPTTGRYHLVQQDGQWHIGPGDATGGTGLSGAMALLINGEPIGAPGGTKNRDSNRLLQVAAGMGMPYTGIDRDRGLLWVLVRKTGGSFSLSHDVPTMRDHLRRLGIDDALAWDGGDSAALIVDDAIIEQPSDYKDRSIPFGLRFSR